GTLRPWLLFFSFFFPAEDGIRDFHVTGVQTCALPILRLTADDDFEIEMPAFLVEFLNEDLEAAEFFYQLPKSHQNYYLNWINGRSEERRGRKECRAPRSL